MGDVIRGSFQDDKLAARITERDGALFLELTDRVASRTWPATPLLQLEVHDKRLRREERVNKYRVEALEFTNTGMHVTIHEATYQTAVGVWFEIVNGELSVKFATAEAYENEPRLYRLFSVDVLPGLMRVEGARGRLLLPINGAVLCHPANKPAVADRFMLYMEQPRWELATILPIAAAWDERSGLMAIATQAAAEAQCRVATDGKGGGQVGFAFVLRQLWVDPVEPAVREFRFIPIPPKADPVHFVAKRLRRHVIEDFKKPTLKQRAEESPEVAYQLKTLTIKLFHGIQNTGTGISDPQGKPPSHYINTMTFAEAGDCLKKLHAGGIPRLYLQSTGWNPRGHDGLWPTRFPIDLRSGGEDGFREMARTAHGLGYQLQVHDNYRCNHPHAPNWSAEHVILDVYGEPMVEGWWGGGVEYNGWPGAMPEEKVGGHMRRIKDLGVRGMGYCDYWFCPLEVNYHPKWKGTRSDHQRGIEKVLSEVKRIFGSVGTEFGTLPACVLCDYIAAGPAYGDYIPSQIRAYPHWPVSNLVDEPLPVLGLAMHGLVLYPASGGPTWENAMASIVWGSLPRDEWGVRPVSMGGIRVFDGSRVSHLKALNDLCVERFGHLAAEEMTRGTLSSDFKQVQSTYADGTRVEADFNTKELVVNGKRVEQPAMLV